MPNYFDETNYFYTNFILFIILDPTIFAGHTSGIRHVIFFRNDTHLVTCADDKTLRVWDRASGKVCIAKII